MNNLSIGFFIIVILLMVIIYQALKIHLIKKELNEIKEYLKHSITNDTNSLLTTSCSDRFIKNYVLELNELLKDLIVQRNKYISKNREWRYNISNISHDIRTPLTAIVGYINLIKKENMSKHMTRYIAVIENRFEYLQQLTDEFFEYSLLEDQLKDNIKKIVINDLLEESIIGFYAAFNNRDLVPIINITDIKVIRDLNPTLVSRLFTNILSNILKYSDGSIEIELTKDGYIYFINETTKLSYIQMNQLFKRYYTIDKSKNSSGLGLEISQYLVSQMNGTISANMDNDKLIILIKL